MKDWELIFPFIFIINMNLCYLLNVRVKQKTDLKCQTTRQPSVWTQYEEDESLRWLVFEITTLKTS